MRKLALEYPQYGWERNMGYPTKEHVDGIIKLDIRLTIARVSI